MTTLTDPSFGQAQQQSRPLHLHTLDSLCADLISGRAVDVESGQFSLSTTDARSILHWYSRRRDKWGARLSEVDADAIADCVGVAPPAIATLGSSAEPLKRRLKLKKIQAHRFGGLHAYGSLTAPPEDFIFEPNTAITLFEGWNGTGKTSLLNAVVWCLTGELLRPQRPPSAGSDEYNCSIDRGVFEGSQVLSNHTLTPVTPLPNTSIFMPAPDQDIPVDTWVELTFVDENQFEFPPVRRTQNRGKNGKIVEIPPDLTSLGCDPIAFKLSTTMPALLQHIKIGSASDLGRAVSELTGLGALVTLRDHAKAARNYLIKTSKKKCDTAIQQANLRFTEATSDLERQFAEFPGMRPGIALPVPTNDEKLEDQVTVLTEHFNTSKAAALKEAQSILGSGFNPYEETSRTDLVENSGLAKAELQRIGQLASAARLGALARLTDKELQDTAELVEAIQGEAQVIANLLAEPELARRKQLYAQVASWMKAHNTTDTSLCHLCSSPLLEQLDPVTGKLVTKHLKDAQLENPELLAQTVQTWLAHTLANLAEKLPAALREERIKDLPSLPSDLIRAAICVELFAEAPFKGALLALQTETTNVFSKYVTALTPFNEPALLQLPDLLQAPAKQLGVMIARIQRAVAFSKWRNDSKDELATLFAKVVGKATTINDAADAAQPDVINPASPLFVKLTALQGIVDGSTPITNAQILCKRMSDSLTARRKAETRIATFEAAAAALTELEKLGQLASLQITALQKALDSRARSWRDKIYHDPNSSGHKLKRTSMSADGVIDFHVGSETITAPAQHVSNASALRSGLIGFFLAFREHVLNARGGLDIVLFDDPQELLDQHNREKMGAALIELASLKSQIIITTYDKRFAQIVVEEGTANAKVSHYSLHAVNAQRNRIEISPARHHVDEKRAHFESNLDDHQAAADYANATRIYLETRLRDLFDDPIYPAYASNSSKPGFGDHLDHLRGLVATPPNDLFRHPLIQGFAKNPALVSSHDCYRVLNDSHHNPSSVSYGRVKAIAAPLRDLSRTVELMHQAFRDWRWRNKLPESVANDNLPALKAIDTKLFKLPICPDLAAFTGGSMETASQEEPSEVFQSSWFTDKALFYVRADNLGFAIPAGSIAIAETTASDGRDRNLVIARKKGETLARRLFRQKDVVGYALAAETPDPRQSPPTKLVRADEYAIHRIVGCLFTEIVPPQSSREAVELEKGDILSGIEAIYRLVKESAVPLALPGQILLGGKVILGSEFGQYEGRIAALTLHDGSHVLKRIGGTVAKKHAYARHFETIGGLGQSVVLQTEQVEDSAFDAPVIEHARLAIGVIYEGVT
jgi:recombinational DNA repair ATPase RecF